MGKAYLVTATDTGAGKTYVTTLLLKGLKKKGMMAAAFKPIESGCAKNGESLIPSDGSTYHSLMGEEDFSLEDVCPARFEEPLSPNIVAREKGPVPDLEMLREKIAWWERRTDVLLVEGAGGILVEMVDGYTFADLAADTGLEIILVAPNRLGVLNHVALTVKYLEFTGIPLKGIILNDVSGIETPAGRKNPDELKRLYGELYMGRVSFRQTSLPHDLMLRLNIFRLKKN